jgi:AAA family ATP:ADP antiporter
MRMPADELALPVPAVGPPSSIADRFFGLFGDVRPGEGQNVLLLFANIFILLVAYYVLKTVREPLILASGAEVKTYAAAAQAALLVAYVPAYGWLASRLSARRLVTTVLLFFFTCIQLFFFAGLAGISYIGVIFYVFVGIFSLTLIAQFWSFANDIYEKTEGDRLFPLIAIGATAGAPLGAALAERLFAGGFSPWTMMQIAAILLLVHLGLFSSVRRDGAGRARREKMSETSNGFGLVLHSRYLALIAILLVVLNIVNTTGEYILSRLVTDQARTSGIANTGAYIGSFYGNYFFWVNIASVIFQTLLVARIVKLTGIAGVLFALPIAALGAYGLVASSAGLMLVRWVKTAENAVDYSFMNTAKQMLWLPTTRDQKYKGKQAIDTFFVRFGDLMAAAVVFIGTQFLTLRPGGFAFANLIFVAVAFAIALYLLRENRRLSASTTPSE